LDADSDSFLWAILALNCVCEVSHAGDDNYTLKCLDQIPRDMQSFYSRIMERIMNQPSALSQIAQRVLGRMFFCKDATTGL
jgi:hypothetical protein